MGETRKPPVLRQSGRVLRLLSRREKAVFWILVVLRFVVNLMDIAGIALMAVAVNFLIAAPGASSPLSGVFKILGMHVDARGSKLPALFTIGIAVVLIFIVKAVVSLALMAKSANQISDLEIRYSKVWMEALTDSRGRFNALPLKEDIGYVVTAGAYSIFQRTLISLSTLLAESAGLLATFLTLCFIQPAMTTGVLIYFGVIGWILQSFVGKRAGIYAQTYTDSHVAAVRSVRELIENENILFLSGRKSFFTNRFSNLNRLLAEARQKPHLSTTSLDTL